MIERIKTRREALAAQLETAKAQYAQIERTLAQLGRSMDAMQGGLQELDALLTPDTSTISGDPIGEQRPGAVSGGA